MPTLLETLMSQVKANIKEISNQELKSKIGSQEVMILDVRSEKSWQQSHLPGAVSCERGMLEFNIEKIIPDLNQEIVVYCGGGMQSALSTESLQRMGYVNVRSLTEGYKGWVNQKLPIESN